MVDEYKYYAIVDEEYGVDNPVAVVRYHAKARVPFGEEAFTRNLKWEPSTILLDIRQGRSYEDFKEITKEQAEAFVAHVSARLKQEFSDQDFRQKEEVSAAYLGLPEVEQIARRAHAAQTDKAGKPYVEHLAAVVIGVRARGGSDAQITAAWLHDAFEDGVLSFDWLASAALPEETKMIIFALTKRVNEPMEDYAKRILATPGALLVKEADLEHNTEPNRLTVLDSATRNRLTEKYARMRSLLGIASS